MIFDDETTFQPHRIAGRVANTGEHDISTLATTLNIRRTIWATIFRTNCSWGGDIKVRLYPSCRMGVWAPDSDRNLNSCTQSEWYASKTCLNLHTPAAAVFNRLDNKSRLALGP